MRTEYICTNLVYIAKKSVDYLNKKGANLVNREDMLDIRFVYAKMIVFKGEDDVVIFDKNCFSNHIKDILNTYSHFEVIDGGTYWLVRWL